MKRLIFLGVMCLLCNSVVGCIPFPFEMSNNPTDYGRQTIDIDNRNRTLEGELRNNKTLLEKELSQLHKEKIGIEKDIAALEIRKAELNKQLPLLDQQIGKKLEELRKLQNSIEMHQKKIKELKAAQKTTEHGYDTSKKTFPQNIVNINYGGHELKFVRIKPESGSNTINIELMEEKAKELYQQARLLTSNPLYPYILKAVSERHMTKVINEFWIQTEPIGERLYKEIVPDGSADRVSYNDAQRVIGRLNSWCESSDRCRGYRFDLPTEEQFVYLTRKIYDPANRNSDFTPCQHLSSRNNGGITKLLGNKWQLTKSLCSPPQWSEDLNDPIRQCGDHTYIKKGGTANSVDATECVPEYRAESSPDVREPNTTIRLVLIPSSSI